MDFYKIILTERRHIRRLSYFKVFNCCNIIFEFFNLTSKNNVENINLILNTSYKFAKPLTGFR